MIKYKLTCKNCNKFFDSWFSSSKEYDKLKEQQHYITDKSLIDIIDNMERLLRALRKHIIRTDI